MAQSIWPYIDQKVMSSIDLADKIAAIPVHSVPPKAELVPQAASEEDSAF